jgi:hypothetical protein
MAAVREAYQARVQTIEVELARGVSTSVEILSEVTVLATKLPGVVALYPGKKLSGHDCGTRCDIPFIRAGGTSEALIIVIVEPDLRRCIGVGHSFDHGELARVLCADGAVALVPVQIADIPVVQQSGRERVRPINAVHPRILGIGEALSRQLKR